MSCLRRLKTDSDKEQEEEIFLKVKPIQCMKHQGMEEVADIKGFEQRLEKAGLKDGAEAVITAAHD